ncbi:MAG: competence/damage-inducible protein A [Flavobacteriaceae bacterium]
MKVEIITIGDEILIGQILDSNSKWMATELNNIGVEVYQITSIHDDEKHILKALAEAEKRVDIILITGGLGPTKDDITKRVLAKYFKDDLILHDDIVAHIKGLFKKINYPFTEINKQQALVPSKAKPLTNNYGTAPGMWFEEKGKIIVSMPGVPTEMKGLMTQSVLPLLQQQFDLPFIYHRTILTYGMGESMLAEKIADWENNLPKPLKLAYLPAFGRVRLRISAKGKSKEKITQLVEDEAEKLQPIIGDIILGSEASEPLEVVIGKLLKAQNKTLATAESCTGGAIASLITSVAGASNYFKGAVVSYAAEIKEQLLNVKASTIKKYSVVSKEVAKEMARNARIVLNTDYVIATTGNAGPTTDKTDKSVGIVFIAIATPQNVYVEVFNFGQPREKVIVKATQKALELLRNQLIKNLKK